MYVRNNRNPEFILLNCFTRCLLFECLSQYKPFMGQMYLEFETLEGQYFSTGKYI